MSSVKKLQSISKSLSLNLRLNEVKLILWITSFGIIYHNGGIIFHNGGILDGRGKKAEFSTSDSDTPKQSCLTSITNLRLVYIMERKRKHFAIFAFVNVTFTRGFFHWIGFKKIRHKCAIKNYRQVAPRVQQAKNYEICTFKVLY